MKHIVLFRGIHVTWKVDYKRGQLTAQVKTQNSLVYVDAGVWLEKQNTIFWG